MPEPRNAPRPPAAVWEDVRLRRGDTWILGGPDGGVSGRIEAGQTVALLGANGCGKTTLARTLLGRTWPTGGAVHALGKRLGRTDVRALRRRIAVVSGAAGAGPAASGGPGPGAVVDLRLDAVAAVCTGFFATAGRYDEPTDAQHHAAVELLNTVGLGRRLDHPLRTLSTGERRRVVLARALVTEPELVILDEPTAGLDLPGRERLLAALAGLRAARPAPAVLLITHHPEEIPADADAAWLMAAGRLTHAGPPADVLTDAALSAAFGCDVRVTRRHGRFWVQVAAPPWDLPPG